MSQDSPELSVVVPVHNERENVTVLSQRLGAVLQQYGRPYEIIFVDDGSNDGTFDTLRDLHKDDPRVKVVCFTRNYGQTPALVAGFDHARGQVIVAMDGDLQFHPEDLPQLVDKLAEGYDIVSGCRDRSHDPATRTFPSRAANLMMVYVSGVHMRDFGSTFKAYRRDMLQHLRLYGELHRFIPALASRYGARMVEVPVQWSSRVHGKSHYGLSRTWRVFLDMIAVKFLLEYAGKPLRLFGSLGMGSLALGSLSGILAIAMKLPALGGYSITGNPFLILSALFIIMGVQFITNGLLAEMLTRTYYEGGAVKRIYTVREVLE
ncbi:MAG TPA: glycosyltransferase family 2 protein [Aggregatilineales bacterium]|nr:glycosyltransferase family 2 protein [Aggregatilineales bacterium]